MISINQLTKALLLSLVVAGSVGLSIPDAQASSVTPHKQVAQATTTKKPKTKKKRQKPTTATPSSKSSASSTSKPSATPVPSPTKKP